MIMMDAINKHYHLYFRFRHGSKTVADVIKNT
jgi:hypothetical protein